jgi:hypothetical protein
MSDGGCRVVWVGELERGGKAECERRRDKRVRW